VNQMTPTLQILHGHPTAEDVAVVLLVFDQAMTTRVKAGQSPWQRAARLEGLGGAPLASTHDPRFATYGQRWYP
jgi:hypothetical protein